MVLLGGVSLSRLHGGMATRGQEGLASESSCPVNQDQRQLAPLCQVRRRNRLNMVRPWVGSPETPVSRALYASKYYETEPAIVHIAVYGKHRQVIQRQECCAHANMR